MSVVTDGKSLLSELATGHLHVKIILLFYKDRTYQNGFAYWSINQLKLVATNK